MAVSPVVRIFQIFAGLGSVATTPFVVKFASNQEINNFGEDSRIIIGREESLKKEDPTKNDDKAMMEKALKMMEGDGEDKEKGDKRGCFWMPQLSWIELFFCFNISKLNSLFLFHYDKGAGSTLESRLNRIDNITVSRPVTIHYSQNGKKKVMSHKLKTNLAWMQKWQITFSPNQHCRISNKDSKNYTLICDASSEGRKNQGPWEQNVLRDEVHVPDFQERIKN